MKIIRLNPEQFDNFSSNHPLHTYYQTSNYAKLMSTEGFEPHFYGFTNDNNMLIGATLILVQKLFLGYKYAYAPRGYLIDYDNKEVINEVTKQMKKFLAKNNIVFLKIDPPVVSNKRDKEGHILKSPYTNDLIPYLQKIGYTYFGDNKFFGTLKPRWNAILKATGSSETIFSHFDASVKNKIRKAQSRGVEVLQGNINDIETFHKFVYKKHYKKVTYYKSFAQAFGNRFELYFAKLNTEKYLKNIKQIYEKELQKNEELNENIREAGLTNRISTKLTNSKIQSDKVLAVYKKELENASTLFAKNPQGIIISACAIIVNKYGISLLIEGQNNAYKLFYPTFLVKWAVIEKYAKLGAVYFDLNAITGYFAKTNKFRGLNEMKLGFGAEVTEYIGEFDLVINHTIYDIHKKSRIGKKSMKKSHKVKVDKEKKEKQEQQEQQENDNNKQSEEQE